MASQTVQTQVTAPSAAARDKPLPLSCGSDLLHTPCPQFFPSSSSAVTLVRPVVPAVVSDRPCPNGNDPLLVYKPFCSCPHSLNKYIRTPLLEKASDNLGYNTQNGNVDEVRGSSSVLCVQQILNLPQAYALVFVQFHPFLKTKGRSKIISCFVSAPATSLRVSWWCNNLP